MKPNNAVIENNKKLRDEFKKFEAWMQEKGADGKSRALALQTEIKDALKPKEGPNDKFFSFSKFLNLRLGQIKPSKDDQNIEQEF